MSLAMPPAAKLSGQLSTELSKTEDGIYFASAASADLYTWDLRIINWVRTEVVPSWPHAVVQSADLAVVAQALANYLQDFLVCQEEEFSSFLPGIR